MGSESALPGERLWREILPLRRAKQRTQIDDSGAELHRHELPPAIDLRQWRLQNLVPTGYRIEPAETKASAPHVQGRGEQRGLGGRPRSYVIPHERDGRLGAAPCVQGRTTPTPLT